MNKTVSIPLMFDGHFTNDMLAETLKQLPLIPSIVRYDDDYAGIVRTIHDAQNNDQWEVKTDGVTVKLDWQTVPEEIRQFLKVWLVWDLSISDASSVHVHLSILKKNIRDTCCKDFSPSPV